MRLPPQRSPRACTGEEVVLARDALGKKQRREVRPVETAIEKALGKRKALAHVKVRTSTTHASFTGAPLGELRHLGAALAKLDLPD